MAASSPFPGMDPYMEPRWLDAHAALVIEARNGLNELLPDDLVASAEVYAQVGERPRERRVAPDVQVHEADEATTQWGSGTAVLARPASAPKTSPQVVLKLRTPVRAVRRLRVKEPDTGRLITVLEVVSPTDKRGNGLRRYRRKRDGLLGRGVNVVEIDLNRQGNWRALLRPFEPTPKAVTPYRTVIHRPDKPGRAYLTPIRLQDRLPVIAIPLRPADPTVTLDLQPLLDRVYRTGRYDRLIDYAEPPEPPFGDPGDTAFVSQITSASRSD